MKTILTLLVILVCASCDVNTNAIDPKIDALMTCTIDASSWKASTIKGIDSGGTLSVSASDNNGKNIVLALETDEIKVGAVLDVMSNNLLDDTRYDITKAGQSDSWLATSGSITITATSKSAVSGKFSFTGTDLLGKNKDVKITNGVFTSQIFR